MNNTVDAREELHSKAINLYDKEGRIGLEYATGVGKTFAALRIINYSGAFWHILCPTQSIVEAWEDEIKKHNLNHLFKFVRIYCYQSLHKNAQMGANYVLDEAHNITEKRLQLLLDKTEDDTKFIALSATIDYEKKELLLQLGIKYKSYIKYGIDDAVKSGIIADYDLWVYRVELSQEKVELPRFKNPISEKQAYAQLTRNMNKAIREKNWKSVTFFAIWRKQLLNGLKSKEKVMKDLIARIPDDKRAIVFAGKTEQADRLCKVTFHSNGADGGLEAFRSGETNILGSVAKIREGINVKCDIILRIGVDSKEKNLIQSIGRSVRKNPDNPEKRAIAVVLVGKDTKEEEWLSSNIGNIKNVKVKTIKSQ